MRPLSHRSDPSSSKGPQSLGPQIETDAVSNSPFAAAVAGTTSTSASPSIRSRFMPSSFVTYAPISERGRQTSRAADRKSEEAQRSLAEPPSNLAPVRRRCEQPILGWIRQEAGLDEDRRHVRPVESRDVGALLEAAVDRTEAPDERSLDGPTRP